MKTVWNITKSLTGKKVKTEDIFSTPIQTGSVVHPASYTLDTGSLSQG
jgi:hypothetical protein